MDQNFNHLGPNCKHLAIPSAEVALSIKQLECVIATARATEERAVWLLKLAKATPDVLTKALGIYDRAGGRLRSLQCRLDSMLAQLSED